MRWVVVMRVAQAAQAAWPRLPSERLLYTKAPFSSKQLLSFKQLLVRHQILSSKHLLVSKSLFFSGQRLPSKQLLCTAQLLLSNKQLLLSNKQLISNKKPVSYKPPLVNQPHHASAGRPAALLGYGVRAFSTGPWASGAADRRSTEVKWLYRRFLRRARGLFDPVVREYVLAEVRRRFRRHQTVATVQKAHEYFAAGRKMYRQLGKAIYGERKLASKLVDLAYGRRGHRRYAMLKDFAVAHPEAAPALRDFVPQDLVKRNRTKVFPPAPAAMQAQAEAVMTAGYARRWRRLYGELLGRLPVATPPTEPGRPASLSVSKLTRGTLAPIHPDDLAGMPPLRGKERVGGGGSRRDQAGGGQGADKAGAGRR